MSNWPNYGNATANDVRVVLQVNDAPPLYQVATSIPPGTTSELIFPYLFTGTRDQNLSASEDEPAALNFENYRVTAAIDRESFSREELSADQLIDDSSAVFAARVLNGIPILLVDGGSIGPFRSEARRTTCKAWMCWERG